MRGSGFLQLNAIIVSNVSCRRTKGKIENRNRKRKRETEKKIEIFFWKEKWKREREKKRKMEEINVFIWQKTARLIFSNSPLLNCLHNKPFIFSNLFPCPFAHFFDHFRRVSAYVNFLKNWAIPGHFFLQKWTNFFLFFRVIFFFLTCHH